MTDEIKPADSTVTVDEKTQRELKAITKKRKAEFNPIKTKKGILAQIVAAAYKRECKQ